MKPTPISRAKLSPVEQVKRLTLQTVMALALALAAIAGAVWLSVQPAKIQGPSALAVRPDGQIWLSVDRQLWLLSPQGDLLQTIDLKPVAPKRSGVANLSATSNEAVLVNFRGDASVYKLASLGGKLIEQIKLSTSPHLIGHLERAPTMTSHPDGRLAFATGGGHTVLVFDAAGKEVASTREGTYRFTNGIWWAEEGLWTTDTNGFALKRLDPANAAVLETIQLDGSPAQRFLGVAVASLGSSMLLGSPPPIATVVRLANGMTKGHVVDVFADGKQRPFGKDTSNPQGLVFEPRDIAWISASGGTHALLAVDGERHQIRRFDALGNASTDFGNAQVKRSLAAIKDRRGHLEIAHKLALALGLVLFGFAGFMAWRLERANRALRMVQLDEQETVMLEPRAAGQMGTDPMEARVMLGLSLRAFWPLYALASSLLAIALLWPLAIQHLLSAWGLPSTGAWVIGFMIAMAVAVMWLVQRWLRNKALRPELEPLFNHSALGVLARSIPVREAMQRGERAIEVCTIVRNFGPSLLVLTPHRLMWFNLTARDQTLTKSEALANVIQADTHLGATDGVRGLLSRMGFGSAAELVLHFSDGRRMVAHCASPLTLRRIVRAINADASAARKPIGMSVTNIETEFLDDLPTVQDFTESAFDRTTSGFAATHQDLLQHPTERADARTSVGQQADSDSFTSSSGSAPSALLPTALSALIPGAGQWLQGRFGTGLVMFVAWLLIISIAGPTLHAWFYSTTEVGANALASVVTASLLAQSISAFDAWRMSPRA